MPVTPFNGLPESVIENEKIILFDGVCKLCSGAVSFVHRNDKKKQFRFAWAQEKAGKEIMEWAGFDSDYLETMLYVDQGKCYDKSTGVLKVVRLLDFPWPLFFAAIVVPRFIRDWAYDRVSVNRYKWFGKRARCLVPGKEIESRFL